MIKLNELFGIIFVISIGHSDFDKKHQIYWSSN